MPILRKRNSSRKVKEKSISKWIKICDKEFSLLIRSVGTCQFCGQTEGLQCAHIVGRTNKTLRWNPINAICLCVRCHIFKFHRSPLEFIDWLEERFPERMVYLRENRNKIISRTIEDYKNLLNQLQNRDIKALTILPLDN